LGLRVSVHIAYAADGNYGPYAGISISSVLSRFSRDLGDLHIHLVANRIPVKDLHRIGALAKANGAALSVHHWHGVNHHEFPWRHSKYVTPSTYGKLLLARVLPASVERVIYLDCDTVVLTDITKLWRLTNEIPLLAACPDMHVNGPMSEYKERIGMQPGAPYFNAGVLVLNLAAWREAKIIAKLSDVAKNLPKLSRFYDQDPLNVLLAGQTTQLPATWNVQMSVEPRIAHPLIVHFCGTKKPWQLGYDGAGGDLYRAAKRNSPWRYMLPETGVRRFVRRLKRSAAKKRSKRDG
jgi:lipopolysaccharide biosynthesis glycosyltransferase